MSHSNLASSVISREFGFIRFRPLSFEPLLTQLVVCIYQFSGHDSIISEKSSFQFLLYRKALVTKFDLAIK